MGIVPIGHDFLGVDIHVVTAVQIELQSYCRWEIKIRIQRASTVTRLNGLRGAKLPDIIGACCWAFETFLNTVAFIPDLWKC